MSGVKRSGVNEIRTAFLDYFKANGHEVVPSSPLVPRNDPTLMFTNAGMVQFKNVFTGQEHRPYSRAASSQKCVRAGGKHNDLDNVGYTARHHTFFEMLGNFSFGDYFKAEAIELAWNLITREYGLDKKRLMVTVYHDDDEAYAAWKKLTGFGDDKIVRIASDDNFWRMGDTGPCGPCSEIFFDHGPGIPGGPPGSADADGDRFIEIWNLVFMQYEQRDAETRVPLPKPSIDTGMGLERISAVLQGVHDNYDTDLFRHLIAAIRKERPNLSLEEAQLATYWAGRLGYDDEPATPAEKVIADHLRSSSFLIADGVLPSNEGRGYVLRRIMRRAMRYAHQLGFKEPLMPRLVPALVREMGDAFPELVRAQSSITETLGLEEKRFKKTIERGLGLLKAEQNKLVSSEDWQSGQNLPFPGDVAFKLYDTYGFPLDLTQDVLRRYGNMPTPGESPDEVLTNMLVKIKHNLPNALITNTSVSSSNDGSTIQTLMFAYGDDSNPDIYKVFQIMKTFKDETFIFTYYSTESLFDRFLPLITQMYNSYQIPLFTNVFTSDSNLGKSVLPNGSAGKSNVVDDQLLNYSSKDLGLAIQYPSYLNKAEQDSGIEFVFPNKRAGVILSSSPVQLAPKENYVTTHLSYLNKSLDNLYILNTSRSDVMGYPTAKILFTYKNGTELYKALHFWKIHDNHVRLFTYFVPPEEVFDDLMPTIDRMLRTIKVL